MKKILILVIGIVLTSLSWYLLDLKEDRSRTIKILKTTPIFSDWEAISGTPSIGNVEPGEKLKVVRIRYGKSFMNVKIEKTDGSAGWLIVDSSVEMGSEGSR